MKKERAHFIGPDGRPLCGAELHSLTRLTHDKMAVTCAKCKDRIRDQEAREKGAPEITNCKVLLGWTNTNKETWGLSIINNQWYLVLTFLTPSNQTFRLKKPTYFLKEEKEKAIALRDRICQQLGTVSK